MEGLPPPLKLAPKSPPKRERSVERVPLAEMPQGAPFALSLGKKSKAASNSNSEEPVFDALRDCGKLADGERCVLRTKKPGEVYGSYVYKIFVQGKKEPVKIRKLASVLPRSNNNSGYVNLDGFRAIRNEGKVYETLKGLPEFENYCFPFLKYTDDDQKRYIDFEYVEGDTLQDYIHEHKLSKVARRILLAQCIQALLFLASHGYIHGDIKLDNFWYDTARAKVRIFDFESTKRDPNITDRSSTVSLVNEVDRFINLLELPHEFGFTKAETETLLGMKEESVFEIIAKSETKKEGLEKLIALYEGVLKRLAAGPAARGGASRRGVRRLTRKKRGSK